MNHIHEGLTLLTAMNASHIAHEAFCLHPIFQDNPKMDQHQNLNPRSVALAKAYAETANAFLLPRYMAGQAPQIAHIGTDLKHMLIADKIQNRKDFIQYHQNSHPQSSALSGYFDCWLHHLGVDQHTRQILTNHIIYT
ncbi:hypothetical protein [Acanthopleuribacter pedis]|uniref:Uncharacterized protein n=1 Tax=Acanthopleuribacter pedis TaxID=442870 RepID=A0A8J7Q4N1_9BACT|nr:hypothetical protein [Acanthopleuribacter pedis]MBO1317716.1 hypothetical protein [Acanthopleuribacter pedis]